MIVRVILAGRNHEAFTEKCLRSILRARAGLEHGAELVIDWTDDASEDDERALSLAKKIARDVGPGVSWHIQRRPERRGGLANWLSAIERAGDDDILVFVGADDSIEEGAFEWITRAYEDDACWMTYGTARNDDGSETYSKKWEGHDPRLPPFVWSPMSCRGWLVKNVAHEDLKLNGSYFMSSGDVALTIPMVEMCGQEHLRYIEEHWYTRSIHPENDHNVDSRFQGYCCWEACTRPRYGKLEKKGDKPVRTKHVLSWSIAFSASEKFGAPIRLII